MVILKNILIIISLLSSSFALISHQLMTINGMYIFFLIPILCGFSQIYYSKYLKDKKYILYFLILLSIGSTFHYGNKYINKRDIHVYNTYIYVYINSLIVYYVLCSTYIYIYIYEYT